jgi:recombinational DNA repair ATPase RecF
MKLTRLRLSNFQSFGQEPTAIELEAMCFLLGPNGTGKTAVLQALARLFGFDPSLRRARRTDFHITSDTLSAHALHKLAKKFLDLLGREEAPINVGRRPAHRTRSSWGMRRRRHSFCQELERPLPTARPRSIARTKPSSLSAYPAPPSPTIADGVR